MTLAFYAKRSVGVKWNQAIAQWIRLKFVLKDVILSEAAVQAERRISRGVSALHAGFGKTSIRGDGIRKRTGPPSLSLAGNVEFDTDFVFHLDRSSANGDRRYAEFSLGKPR
jgi:hypothetical protein